MVTLTPRDGGPSGQGQATGSGLGYSGKMTVELAGRRYEGDWIYQPEGGTMGFGSATAFSGGQMATAYGTTYGVSMNGNGRAHLHSADGKAINCGFTYSSWSATGIGECQDQDGKIYDLSIRN